MLSQTVGYSMWMCVCNMCICDIHIMLYIYIYNDIYIVLIHTIVTISDSATNSVVLFPLYDNILDNYTSLLYAFSYNNSKKN